MGELDDLAKQATALTTRVAKLEALTGTIVDRPMPHCAWRSKRGTGDDLFKSATGQPPEARTPATALASAAGDLFKYRPDQARDEGGRFADEGKGRGRGSSGKPRKPKNEATVRAERNARERQRRHQRQREEYRRTLRPVPKLYSNQGATTAEAAIHSAMQRVPQSHYEVLKGVRFFAVKDMGGHGAGELGRGKTIASFMPLLGITVGETFDGIPLLNIEHSAMHEMAHALDYWAAGSILKPYTLSKKLEPTLREEWAALPESMQWYAEMYAPTNHVKELFAELYTAVYGPPRDRRAVDGAGHYMGVLTRDEVLRAFPKSIAQLKLIGSKGGAAADDVPPPSQAAPRPSWWQRWWSSKSLEKYRPDQARDERGRFADEGKGGSVIARLGRSERPDSPKRLRVAPRLTVEKGASAVGVAIRQALTDVPRPHYNLLRLIRMKAVKDTGALARAMGLGGEEGVVVAGAFRPVFGVTVGTHFNGIDFRLDPYNIALHELAHALDYEINFNEDWSLSKELEPIAMEEFNKLSKAQQWYAEAYDPADLPSELFAEAYSAIYSRKPAREYIGTMTHRQFLRAFPNTIAKVKSFATREWTDA